MYRCCLWDEEMVTRASLGYLRRWSVPTCAEGSSSKGSKGDSLSVRLVTCYALRVSHATLINSESNRVLHPFGALPMSRAVPVPP